MELKGYTVTCTYKYKKAGSYQYGMSSADIELPSEIISMLGDDINNHVVLVDDFQNKLKKSLGSSNIKDFKFVKVEEINVFESTDDSTDDSIDDIVKNLSKTLGNIDKDLSKTLLDFDFSKFGSKDFMYDHMSKQTTDMIIDFIKFVKKEKNPLRNRDAEDEMVKTASKVLNDRGVSFNV